MVDRNTIHSILVIKLRNIGDVLLTTPVFGNLRAQFPKARICALVNLGTDAMLTDNPDIDHVFVYDRSARKTSLISRLREESKLIRALRKERFDLVLNLTEGDRGAIVALLSGAAIRVGLDSRKRGFKGKDKIFTSLLTPPPPEMHTVDQNLRYLTVLGLDVAHKRVAFHYLDSARDAMHARLVSLGVEPKCFFHAHVTSRWMFKTMSPVIAARLLQLLTKRSGFPCVLTASSESKELVYLEELRRHLGGEVPFISDLNLKELGALSDMSCFFTGVDSAPMHIAAALNIPVLGVFGPSSAQAWGPWDNDQENSSYNAVRGIQPNGKHIVLQSERDCVPCHRDGCNGSKKSDCLDFDQETLEETVSRLLVNIQL